MQMQIKWGILGTSFISGVMAEAIKSSSTAQLAAVASRSMQSAEKFADHFSVPKKYDDYAALIDDKDIDVVYIGLPNHLHKDWIIRCAQAGKHILCEKPFVISVAEAQAAVAAVQNAGVCCIEALMYRYHPVTKKIQEIINSKIIGEIRLFNANYTADIADVANPTAGGAIRNLGCYPISLVRLLAGEPSDILGAGNLDPQTNNDHQASVILKFTDGAMAVVSTADDIKMTWQFEIHGSKGSLKVISNPWMPSVDHNQIEIRLTDEADLRIINVAAEKPLYTYQIDYLNEQIINHNAANFSSATLLDSIGNTVVLEEWLQQVKRSNTSNQNYWKSKVA